MKSLTKIFFLLVTFLISLYLLIALYVGFNVYKDNKIKSDAIIVLGARAVLNGKDSPCLTSRINHAVELYKDGFAKKIIVSGGNQEAETMSRIAKNSGVNPEDIFEEKYSTSTYENFLYSQKIMQDKNLHSLIIVSEPFHTPRAYLIANYLHIPSTVSAATDSPCWTRWKFLSRYFLREPLAIIDYAIERKL